MYDEDIKAHKAAFQGHGLVCDLGDSTVWVQCSVVTVEFKSSLQRTAVKPDLCFTHEVNDLL